MSTPRCLRTLTGRLRPITAPAIGGPLTRARWSSWRGSSARLLGEYSGPEDLLGPTGLIKELTGALVSRAMDAELTHHLGYDPGSQPPAGQGNRRNGTGSKTLRTDGGPITIEVHRDRQGSFEPQIVPKHQRHFDGFDDKILSISPFKVKGAAG